ncbi:MAG: hypothetical protein LBU37_03715 [Tannerellaceae bacterium]|jgi:hypothetical protein|nr:hypothetical protein [Tannerellaceae bacterium]
MKNLIIFGMMLLAGGSCSMDKDSPIDDHPDITEDIIDTRIKIAIVDSLLQDRLNPESPAYFGETYASGIEVLYLDNGKKRTFLERWYLIYGEPHEEYRTINPPYRSTAEYEAIDCGTLGYYFLDASSIMYADAEEEPVYVYIQYPDGNEDGIKIQLYRNERGNICLMNKIRFND